MVGLSILQKTTTLTIIIILLCNCKSFINVFKGVSHGEIVWKFHSIGPIGLGLAFRGSKFSVSVLQTKFIGRNKRIITPATLYSKMILECL